MDQSHTDTGFRSPFRRMAGFDVRTGLLLLAGFSLLRFGLVMQANATGSYGLVAAIFLLMIVAPWVLLTPPGRRRIGLTRPRGHGEVVVSVLAGAACCCLMILTGTALFGSGEGDAFNYIARAYPAPPNPESRHLMFVISALIAMSFSPIGEELFYRGLVHETLRPRIGGIGAATAEAAAFAIVHLAHFGLVWTSAGWRLLPGPALWWVLGMFLTGLVFVWARRRSASLVGAIGAHMGFNLIMTAWIFYGVPV